MHKLRIKLLLTLIIIFVITGTAFLLTLFGDSNSNITGAAVGDPAAASAPVSPWMVLPGLLFIGFLILTVIYLEQK